MLSKRVCSILVSSIILLGSVRIYPTFSDQIMASESDMQEPSDASVPEVPAVPVFSDPVMAAAECGVEMGACTHSETVRSEDVPPAAPGGDVAVREPSADAAVNTPAEDQAANTPAIDSATDAPIADPAENMPVADIAANASITDSAANAPIIDSAANAPIVDLAANAPIVDSAENEPAENTETGESKKQQDAADTPPAQDASASASEPDPEKDAGRSSSDDDSSDDDSKAETVTFSSDGDSTNETAKPSFDDNLPRTDAPYVPAAETVEPDMTAEAETAVTSDAIVNAEAAETIDDSAPVAAGYDAPPDPPAQAPLLMATDKPRNVKASRTPQNTKNTLTGTGLPQTPDASSESAELPESPESAENTFSLTLANKVYGDNDSSDLGKASFSLLLLAQNLSQNLADSLLSGLEGWMKMEPEDAEDSEYTAYTTTVTLDNGETKTISGLPHGCRVAVTPEAPSSPGDENTEPTFSSSLISDGQYKSGNEDLPLIYPSADSSAGSELTMVNILNRPGSRKPFHIINDSDTDLPLSIEFITSGQWRFSLADSAAADASGQKEVRLTQDASAVVTLPANSYGFLIPDEPEPGQNDSQDGMLFGAILKPMMKTVNAIVSSIGSVDEQLTAFTCSGIQLTDGQYALFRVEDIKEDTTPDENEKTGGKEDPEESEKTGGKDDPEEPESGKETEKGKETESGPDKEPEKPKETEPAGGTVPADETSPSGESEPSSETEGRNETVPLSGNVPTISEDPAIIPGTEISEPESGTQALTSVPSSSEQAPQTPMPKTSVPKAPAPKTSAPKTSEPKAPETLPGKPGKHSGQKPHPDSGSKHVPAHPSTPGSHSTPETPRTYRSPISPEDATREARTAPVPTGDETPFVQMVLLCAFALAASVLFVYALTRAKRRQKGQ